MIEAVGFQNNPIHHFLVVDDDDVDAEFTVRELEKFWMPYTVTRVANGIDAVDWLSSRDQLTHTFVITDIYMPCMDGVELLQMLSFNKRFDDLPIFVFCTSDDQKLIEQILKFKPSGVLKKGEIPNEYDSLSGYLNRKISHGRLAQH